MAIHGTIGLVGGTGKKITDEAIKTDNWERIEKEFTPPDLINVLECYDLTPERREWVNELLKKRMIERGMCLECGENPCTCKKGTA